jgi:cellulose biosynthesis protein BcsQ
MIYLATDHIFYPTEVTYLSFDGLVASIQSTTGYSKKRTQSGLSEIKLSGIIPTKFRPKTLEHQEKYKSLKEGFGDLVWNPLPLSVVWEEAMARRRSIFNYAYDHPVSNDAWKVVQKAKERITSG